ncbi:hypothetical protein TNCT_146521 [Trichonephila clavata]|uniref:Uncharacterized protein n=1 Tax=Trichonephila clavata TaxID=2740835 RepID=A0A8X6GDB6_TRICU|nr:hypothetical protein TNCT_146521 [Trichonephila clavata]
MGFISGIFPYYFYTGPRPDNRRNASLLGISRDYVCCSSTNLRGLLSGRGKNEIRNLFSLLIFHKIPLSKFVYSCCKSKLIESWDPSFPLIISTAYFLQLRCAISSKFSVCENVIQMKQRGSVSVKYLTAFDKAPTWHLSVRKTRIP